ncbi:hypothetical protein [Microbacterium aurum]
MHSHEGTRLPVNVDLSAAVVDACAERVREACGIELLSVVITGDALTDGYLLADAITRQTSDRAPDAVPHLWASAVAARHSA